MVMETRATGTSIGTAFAPPANSPFQVIANSGASVVDDPREIGAGASAKAGGKSASSSTANSETAGAQILNKLSQLLALVQAMSTLVEKKMGTKNQPEQNSAIDNPQSASASQPDIEDEQSDDIENLLRELLGLPKKKKAENSAPPSGGGSSAPSGGIRGDAVHSGGGNGAPVSGSSNTPSRPSTIGASSGASGSGSTNSVGATGAGSGSTSSTETKAATSSTSSGTTPAGFGNYTVDSCVDDINKLIANGAEGRKNPPSEAEKITIAQGVMDGVAANGPWPVSNADAAKYMLCIMDKESKLCQQGRDDGPKNGFQCQEQRFNQCKESEEGKAYMKANGINPDMQFSEMNACSRDSIMVGMWCLKNPKKEWVDTPGVASSLGVPELKKDTMEFYRGFWNANPGENADHKRVVDLNFTKTLHGSSLETE